MIFMATISGRGQGTMPTKPAPENVGIAGNTWYIRTSTGAYGSRLVPSGRATFNLEHEALG